MDSELLGRLNVRNEARLLYQMIGDENTVEELRELIAVPPKIEGILQAYVKSGAGKRSSIALALLFHLLSFCTSAPAE